MGIFKSRTVWFQVLSAVAAVAGVIPLPPEMLAVIVSVVNVGLRLVTTSPIATR